MGRATILENKGEGKYRVQYKFGTEAITRELQILDNKVIELNNGIVKLMDEITALGTEFTATNVALQAVLAEPGPMTPDRKKRLSAALGYLSKIGIELKGKEAALALSKAQKEEAVHRSLSLSALPESEERELWMADYSAEIQPTGADIPTIEIAGEAHGENWALLYPAKNEAPIAFDQVLHGEREHALAISPAACFAAWAMLPGWQKYRPSYRVGKILELRDGGLARVELRVPLVSSEQNLPIPPSDPMAVDVIFERQTHERVPFEYMDCDAIAFKVGDEVLIKYKAQDSAQPVIIGFAHDPEPCSAINVYTSAKERLRYAPRGGKKQEGAWVSVKQPTVPRFGSCYWVGDGGAVSWVGWRARYFAARVGTIDARFPDPEDGFTSRSLFHRGQDVGPCPGIVLGGCIRKKHLFAVCRVGEHEVLYSRPLVGGKTWKEIARVNASTWPVLTPWYFSQSGLKAASAKYIGFDGFNSFGTAMQVVELTRTGEAAEPPFAATFRANTQTPVTVVFGLAAIATERQFAVDYVGESLVTLDRRYEFYFTEERRIFISCSALNYEIEDFHTAQSGTLPFVRTQKTPTSIDHLNITGGVGKIVSVTRRIDGTAVSFVEENTITVTVTQTLTLASGIDKLVMAPITQTASTTFAPGVPSPTAHVLLNSVFQEYASLYPVSYTVATRTGHLVTSMPLLGFGRAMPSLPVSSRLRLGGGGPIGAG